jgi:serine/threonine protein kinase
MLYTTIVLNKCYHFDNTDRDLKPDNIGFDIRGDVKLFDFGLAKELDETMKSGYCSDFYELSGNTGSLRYMAPEIALSEPYNLTADVYSFGLLLWQVCSLDLPYDGMTRRDHAEYVVRGSERPTLSSTWSTALRIVMKRSWEPNPATRPSMDSIHKILRQEIAAMRDGDETGLENIKRRSTFVLNKESVANPVQTLTKASELMLSAQTSTRNLLSNVVEQSTASQRQATAA